MRCEDGRRCRRCQRVKFVAKGAVKRRGVSLTTNQQRHIAALLKANDSLKDAITRRDKQIEDMGKDRKDMHNELCGRCGSYLYEHNGACDGCRWREM